MAKPYSWTGARKINWFPRITKSTTGLGQSILDSFGGFNQTPQKGRGGGGNPYAGILNEYLNSTKANFGAQSAADAATRDATLRRMIISYGAAPDFDKLGISGDARGFLKGALDPKTLGYAAQNEKEGTSIHARGEHANMLANRKIPALLAARGMLRSGQTGSDLSEQALAHKIQGFDTLNELLGGIEGTVGSFLAAERARADALAQAEMQARMAAYENYGGDMYGDGGYGQNLMDWIRRPQPRPVRSGAPRRVAMVPGRRYNPHTMLPRGI